MRRIIIFFIIIIILGGISFWYFSANHNVSCKNCIGVALNPGDLPDIYTDGNIGFSVRYPKGYLLDNSYVYQALGPGKEINGVKFTVPQSYASGTNLSTDTGISIENIHTEQNCTADLFLSAETNTQTINDNSVEYSFASSSDAGVGNRYEEYVWSLPNTNPCIGIRYFIHYTVIENYPEGLVTEFNKNELINEFDEIRHSLVCCSDKI